MTGGILAKLKLLETRHQSIQERQDVIDELALDTLFKMEVLLSKLKAYKAKQLENKGDEGENLRSSSADEDKVVQFLLFFFCRRRCRK